MQSIDFEKLSVALKKATDIEIKTRVKTFFDVSGFPHYENTISNILAFFFNINEEHGFKDLWLRSLFECYNIRANTNILPGELEDIEREHPTDDKKRIDILISLDNAIVVIENKIYASPYNPFNSYHKEVIKNYKDGKSIVEILLSLKAEKDQKTKFDTAFYNITYQSLVEQVKKNIGDYIEYANEKWLLFMKEVINNIENLGDRENMNKEWQKFLKETEDSISQFFGNYSNDIQSKITFIKNLEQGVSECLNDTDLKIGVYNTQNSESFKEHISLYIDIPRCDNTIVIEPRIIRKKPAFLFLDLWNRNNKRYDWSSKRDYFLKDYPNAKIDYDGWGGFLRLKSFDFGEDISLPDIINEIVKIVGLVRTINV